MASTKSTTKANPCPICGNSNGHCKSGTERDNLIFCHTHEFRQGLEIAGYEAVKQSSDWCVFASIDSTKPQQPTQSKRPAKKLKPWTAKQRDKAFRDFISGKTLHPDDLADLHRRGLDDRQIEAWGVASLEGENPGYICPCYSPDGLIVGAQWRLRDAGDGARYKWISWLGGGTHFNGELPLTCHRPIDRKPTGIAIVEGIGAKSFITAQRSGMVTIGAGAAAQFAGSETHWKNYLATLSAELNTKVIHFYPDAGAVQNNSVIRHYRAFFDAAIEWGYQIQIAWWGQIKKGAMPDVDELDSLTGIKFIELGEFEAIVKEELGDLQVESPKSNAAKGFSKVVSIHTGAPIVPIDSLDVEIHKLLDLNLTGSKLQAEKIKLRQSSALTDREFAQLWDVVERDYEVGSESSPAEIRRLLRAKRSSLALADVVPGAIAAPLARLAQMMNLREEVYLVSLLTTIGSLAQNGTTLLLHKGLGFEVAPNLYSAVVAVASQRKSPVISQVATKPLRILEKEARQAHKRSLESWQERKAEAKANDEPFNEPEPSPEIYFFTKASGEAILQQANRCRNRGLLNLSDELAGVFKSKNQYRGGRGSDGEDMLSYYDAAGGKTLRVDGIRNDVDSLNYGILGGIQPRVLADFLGNCEDSNGNWARFIFVNQPIAAATWPEGDFDNWDITTMLADYYRTISLYDPVQYRLSREAEARFGQLYNELEQRRVTESNPALQAVIGKSAGRIGKVALGLHLLESTAAGIAVPSLEISMATIEKAAMIAELAIEQIRAIYSDCDTDNQQNPVMAKIVELSQRKGEVSARDVYQSLPSKGDRPNTAKIRQLFSELAGQGFGEVMGEGKSIQFLAYTEQVKPVEAEPEPKPIDPEIQPGDYVLLASDSYQGLEPGQKMLIVRLEEAEGRLFALAMDDEGTNHSIWLCHLQKTYKPTIEREAS